MCDGQKGFEGIEAVAASYLRLHPEVCACVYLWLCVCVCVYGFVYVCLCFCVCVLSGHRTIIRPIWWCGQRPSTPAHILRYQLSFTRPTSSVRPPFFGMKPSLETSNKNWETRLLSSFWRHHQLSFCLLWLKYLLTHFGSEVHEEWEMKFIYPPFCIHHIQNGILAV